MSQAEAKDDNRSNIPEAEEKGDYQSEMAEDKEEYSQSEMGETEIEGNYLSGTEMAAKDSIIDKELHEMAETIKQQGNEFYTESKFAEAIECYSQAIDMQPSCVTYYGNRAAAFMMLKKYKDGLRDAQMAVRLDPMFVKGYLREGKCHMMLGNARAASNSYSRVLEIEPNNETASEELKSLEKLQEMEAKADLSFIREEYQTAVFCLDRCLNFSPACYQFKVRKAEALVLLGRAQEGQEVANNVLVHEEMDADAMYVRGLSMYYMDHTQRAYAQFQHLLRSFPDHVKAREALKRVRVFMETKEAGTSAFNENRLNEAYEYYSKALLVDAKNSASNSKVFCNRALVSIKMNMLQKAIDDCTEAIKLNGNYVKAYMNRAKCYMDLKKYEDAVMDYEQIYKLNKTNETKQLLREARLALKNDTRKDYYKILGVERSATSEAIKKAYKKKALIHHPDRHVHSSKEVQIKEEWKFKELGEAYSVLSDSQRRVQYDRSLNTEGMNSTFAVHPEQVFTGFFGNMTVHQVYQHAAPQAGNSGTFPGSIFIFRFG